MAKHGHLLEAGNWASRSLTKVSQQLYIRSEPTVGFG